MKKLLVCIMIVLLLMLTGCTESNEHNQLVIHAKVRYFDGSCDTLEIYKWFASASGTVTLFTTDGRKTVIGANNVILIEETEEQYEH